MPFAKADIDLTEKLIRWIRIIDPNLRQHTCVLLGAENTDKNRQIGFANDLREVFGYVGSIRQVQPDPVPCPWPIGSIILFRIMSRYIAKAYNQPWLWMEPDCVPLHPGWLDMLSLEYENCGKKYMGFVWDKPSRHMNGNGFYPAGFIYESVSRMAFDVELAPKVLPSVHHSQMMQHVWNIDENGNFGAKGKPPTFPDEKSLSILHQDAVFFHRCKDGTLIDRLMEQEGIEPARPTSVISRILEKVTGSNPCDPNRIDPRTCIVCLGRYGDIMSAIPIAKAISKEIGGPVPWLASTQFVDVLEGCSFIRPVPWNGPYNQMPSACAEATKNFNNVIRAQIFSTPESEQYKTGQVAHNRIAWKLAGFEKEWDNPKMTLDFDKRDPVQERIIIRDKVKQTTKPVLLLALTGGNSGPLPTGAELQKRITQDFQDTYQIIDIATIRAHRIYDLLGLMDVATAMVTIDSAPVHLAGAQMALPVLMLEPEDRYQCAEPRSRVEKTVKYGKVFEDYSVISKWLKSKSEPPKIWHSFERHNNPSDREKRAQTTWPTMWSGFGWVPVPLAEPYPRDSKEIGDPRGVPYINDVLAKALEHAMPQDIIVFTNSDITLLPGLHADILSKLSVFPATCSSRRDFKTFSDVRPFEYSKVHPHCGRDMFAFRAWWLAKYLPTFPSLFIGSNEWDNVFLNFMRKKCGTLITGDWRPTHATAVTDCEIASTNVLHEDHLPYSNQHVYHPGNLWNRIRMFEWASRTIPNNQFSYLNELYRQYQRGEVKFLSCNPRRSFFRLWDGVTASQAASNRFDATRQLIPSP